MRLVKRKLFKKLSFKSTILVFGSIALVNPVFSNPVEFTCTVTGSYGVKNRTTVNPTGKKIYPTKLAKNVSQEFEKFKVIFDINKGEGNINGSGAIILSRIHSSKDKGPKAPVILTYSSKMLTNSANPNDINTTYKEKIFNSRYFILDNGKSKSSSFTLIDTSKDNFTEIKINQNKKKFNVDKNILHETYYGRCKQPKN